MKNKIKTIIFDLGGVMLDLDLNSTIQAFTSLLNWRPTELDNLHFGNTFFQQYERGQINDQEFRSEIRLLSKNKISDDSIDKAWNTMLLQFPKNRIDVVIALKKRYSVMVLSNTNQIHSVKFNDLIAASTGYKSLDDVFDRLYYSHILKMRKPEPGIYQFVLNENRLAPEETLFLDDNKENLEAAGKLGIKTVHINHPNTIFETFKAWI
ncbi:MAG: HAD family phosphatase [Bacteroidetes bacterium]|nr:HAD family phosphatase [Bacteroidota bacterium]MDA1120094.1 HAD family phosphatase [Bacteroidota bacterium]